jgi:molybdopterin synthase sulfur carrier subunit
LNWEEAMKVNFYATYRPIVGGKTIEFDVDHGITISQLVEAIIERFPAMRREMLDENGNLYSHVHIFVNGRDACYLESGMSTVIQAEDVLNIFPPVGGG